MTDRYYDKNWEQKRQATLARDDGRCQSCGRRDDLHVHHVTPLREFDDPEDANYLDNLVTLCKYCHKEWEGREQRPVLADAETETSVTGVVNELTYETVFRHALGGALPEIYYRWFKSNPGYCSHCLKDLPRKPRRDYLPRFRRMIQATIREKQQLPDPTIQQRGEVVEEYCEQCRREDCPWHSEPVRHSKAIRLWYHFAQHFGKLSKSTAFSGYTKLRNVPHTRQLGDPESTRFARVAAGVLGIPMPEVHGVTWDFCVPERRVKNERDPSGEEKLELLGARDDWWGYDRESG